MLPAWLDVVSDPVLEATKAPAVVELHGELLRQWGSSEVWRLSFGLNSVIVKRGTDGQAGEAAAYERFVVPLELPAPALLHQHRSDGAGMIVLEDVGRVTLEQEPTAEGFVAAAELLATIRSRPVDGPSEFPPERVKELADRIGRIGFDLGPLTEALAGLHRDAPTAVVHGDYVPKNLVTDGMRWTAIDWPGAYAAPHLSDLYTLVRDAVALGHDRAPIVAHYLDAAGGNPALVERQMLVGGGCFYLVALRFIVEEGLRTIPESAGWIDGLLGELEDVVGALT
ncbi:thiamine kinase-like enzyme [Kribbella sp. VKM Ac-2571]|uniref:phosphotransferase family protein n=1 Tax=Kribbella sp. VKM Ac-2571 TaxID=2512222 RepID=UPI00105FE197|nr:phosphotransferase [Kribbella sp. VKM Ac-2571]TDO68720.1 thiamine kinase-like enzyme [Kribbella sp. VKM Ac-2571]